MKIYFTEEAINRLSKYVLLTSSYIRLNYGIGGCDNPFDGVIRLQLISTIPNEHIRMSTNWTFVYIEQPMLFFMENDITIDCQSGVLLARSKSQIYGLIIEYEEEQDDSSDNWY